MEFEDIRIIVENGTLQEVGSCLETLKTPLPESEMILLLRIAEFREAKKKEKLGIVESIAKKIMISGPLSDLNKGGDAALAAYCGTVEMMKLAKSRGISFSEYSSLGMPLFVAIQRNNLEIVKYLVEEEGVPADLSYSSFPSFKTLIRNSLKIAMNVENKDILNFLLSQSNGYNSSMLLSSIQKGDKEMVENIVSSGISIEEEHILMLRHGEMVDVLLNLGWDGKMPTIPPDDNKPTIWDHWYRGFITADFELVDKITTLGVPLEPADISRCFGNASIQKLKHLLSLTTNPHQSFQLNKRFDDIGTLLDWAILYREFAVVEFLHAQGFPKPSIVQLEDDSEDVVQKRNWLSELRN